MSGRTRTVELEYIAKIDKLEKELGKLPGISDREARKMVKGLDVELKKATRATKRAAQQSQTAYQKLGGTLEGTKRATEALGGAAGETSGRIEHMGRAVLELVGALGPVGAGLAATTLALGGLTAAGYAAALQAHDLQIELEEAGRTPVISPEQRTQIAQLDAAVEEAKLSVQELVVTLGSEFAPALTTVVSASGDAIDTTREWVGTISDLYSWLQDLLRPLHAVLSLGMSEVFRAVAEDTSEYADAASLAALQTREWKEQAEDLTDVLRDQNDEIERRQLDEVQAMEAQAAREAAEAQRTYEERVRAAQQAAEKAARERAKAAAEAAAAEVAAAEQAARERDRIDTEARALREETHREMLARISEREAERQSAHEQHLQALVDAERQASRQIAEIRAAALDVAFDGYEALALVVDDFHRRQGEQARDQHDAALRRLDEQRARRAELHAALLAETDEGKRARIKAEIAATNASINGNKKTAQIAAQEQLKAFKARKRMAILEVQINSAAAILRGFAQVGPPPAPGGYAVIASVAAAKIAQLALISAQKAPAQLHDGGIVSRGPDERPATLRSGEAVLNQRAADQLGRDGVDRINRTASTGGGAYVVNLDGRTVAKGLAPRIRLMVETYAAEVGGSYPGLVSVY